MTDRVLFAAIIGWAVLASMASGQCWECEQSRNEAGEIVYPGVECAPVSVSDEGSTECHVLVDPVSGNRCVFKNVNTGQPGQDCAWEPPPGNGHTSPPDQGCEWTSFQEKSEDKTEPHRMTPNGEAVEDWKSEPPVLATAVG